MRCNPKHGPLVVSLAAALLTVAASLPQPARATDTTTFTRTVTGNGLSCRDFDAAHILHEAEVAMPVDPLPEYPVWNTDGTLRVLTLTYNDTNKGRVMDWAQEVGNEPSIHHVSLENATTGVVYSYDPPVREHRGLYLDATAATQAIRTFTTTPPADNVPTKATFCYSMPQQTGLEGCTLGYWKVRQHHDSWPAPYVPGTNQRLVFGPAAYDASLLTALNYKGGPGVEGGKRLLLKQAVAAFLNANSGAAGVEYPITSAQVVSMTQMALQSNDRDIMLSLARTLDAYNNQGCPLN